MRNSFNVTAVIGALILVTGLIVFPSKNNINNNLLMFDRPNQIAHATTVGMQLHWSRSYDRAFLEKTDAGPPIYTLTPQKARAVPKWTSSLYLFQKLPANIENRTIPGGPNGTKVSITIVRPPNEQ